MNAVVIQARMGSQRFPGKTLALLAGRPLLEHVVRRCRLSEADRIVVATTDDKQDDKIGYWCREHRVSLVRGHQYDLVSRFLAVASKYDVETIIRVCGDSPLINPGHINQLIWSYEESPQDYISFRCPSTGRPAILKRFGVPELFTTAALERLHWHLTAAHEHVTFGFYGHMAVTTRWIDLPPDTPENTTIDTPDDLERLEKKCRSQLLAE